MTQAELEEAARQANAHEFIMALPQGYQTMVTDKWVHVAVLLAGPSTANN